MALTGSGQITLTDIYDEFTSTHSGSEEIQLSDYHDKGNAPASGEIQLAADFYGTSNMPQWAGTRAIYGGGYTSAYVNICDSKTIASTGNCSSYGTLYHTRGTHGSCSDQSYMISGSGAASYANIIGFDRKVFASNTNASDWGDMDAMRYNNPSAVSNGVRGCWGGGYSASGGVYHANIRYKTLSSSGNTSAFGNLRRGASNQGAEGGDTRGAWSGGFTHGPSTYYNEIDYITIASTGNYTNFGNLIGNNAYQGGVASTVRIVFGGGLYSGFRNELQYITVASTGNATDAANLQAGNFNPRGVSDNSKGEFYGGYDTNQTDRIQYFTISSIGDASDNGNLVATNGQGDVSSGI